MQAKAACFRLLPQCLAIALESKHRESFLQAKRRLGQAIEKKRFTLPEKWYIMFKLSRLTLLT